MSFPITIQLITVSSVTNFYKTLSWNWPNRNVQFQCQFVISYISQKKNVALVGNTSKLFAKGGLIVVYLDNHLARDLINRLTIYINILDPFTYLFCFTENHAFWSSSSLPSAKETSNGRTTENLSRAFSICGVCACHLPPTTKCWNFLFLLFE